MKKIVSLLLALVVMVGVTSLTMQKASAATIENTNMYIRIDGIEGEARNAAHNCWIDVIDFKQEISRDTMDERMVTLTISHYVDKATSKITNAYYNGQIIREVRFEKMQNLSGKETLLYSVNLSSAKITSVVIESDESSNLVETFTVTGTFVSNS